MKKFVLLLLPCLFFFQNSFSFHIIGTEIGYESLGQDNYKIKLKVYRDCSSPFAAQFDDPLYMAIYKASDETPVQLLSIPFPGAQSITSQQCSPFPFSACVQKAEYDATVNLPFIAGGYIVVDQRCCRNAILSNLSDPSSIGMTSFILISDSALSEGNTTPLYLNQPPTSVICLNQLYTYNYNYYDVNGDHSVFILLLLTQERIK